MPTLSPLHPAWLDPKRPSGAVSTTAHRLPPTPAPLSACVLGTGSGGNCTVVKPAPRDRPDAPPAVLLIDAGLGPRATTRRLAQAGLALSDVRAVCLTHLDTDHFRPSWATACLKHGIHLHLDRWHAPRFDRLRGADALHAAGLVHPFDPAANTPFAPHPDLPLLARTVRLQHDTQGTVGYRLTTTCKHAAALAYATDLGHAPPALIQLFANADLLCLEANYDERMTTQSERPAYVNRRNLSDSGHLSNEQAFDAVQRIAAASGVPPRHVVLMHRSAQCNHPTKVRRVFERDPRLARRITLAEQRKRTRWFHAKPAPAVRRAQWPLFDPTIPATPPRGSRRSLFKAG